MINIKLMFVFLLCLLFFYINADDFNFKYKIKISKKQIKANNKLQLLKDWQYYNNKINLIKSIKVVRFNNKIDFNNYSTITCLEDFKKQHDIYFKQIKIFRLKTIRF